MRFAVPLMLLAVSGASPAHAGPPPMSAYMDCARAIGVAINDKLAVVPGERSGDKGLFVYTDRSAYFLPLGAPYIEHGGVQEFFLRTTISFIGDIFLIFREQAPGSLSNAQSAIGFHTAMPAEVTRESYRYTSPNISRGDQALDVLRRRLKEKVATVKDFLNEKNRFSTPAEAKAAFEVDRLVYNARLARCRIDGDRELNLVVAEEVRKLEPGFTGVTIWEKQVGGRPVSSSQ